MERSLAGEFEVIVCERLLAEVTKALNYPKLRKRIAPADAAAFVELVRGVAELAPDPEEPPPITSPDPGDDYLLALAARERAHLVTGDEHLLSLRRHAAVLSPRAFLTALDAV